MKARTISLVCLSLLLITGTGQSAATSMQAKHSQGKASILDNYGRLPLVFEANDGQVDAQVKFLSRGAGYKLYLTHNEAVLALHKAATPKLQWLGQNVLPQEEPSAVLRMTLVGANPKAEIAGRNELPGKSNYFIGNDPKKWQTNVRQYARVGYANVYPGIDLVYYGNQHELEYDFVVQPGADPNMIRLAITGATQLKLDQGELVMTTSSGDVRLRSPQVYQQKNGTRVDIPSHYVTKTNSEVGFGIACYDHSRPLVIDPVLSYSTYLGGSGEERPFAIAVDAAGNAYVAGTTASADFPTFNPIQPTQHGAYDAFITKISADGSALVYSTYLGGSSDDSVNAMAVDSSGLYLTGFTGSANFPTLNPIQPNLHGWRNAFVMEINIAGDALVFSTYLGGGEDYGWGIVADSSGNIHVRGDTRSPSFPVVNAIQPNLGSPWAFDCFVAEFSPDGSSLLYSTYWGGINAEGGVGIAVDAAGNTYVGGYTDSTNFPTVNPIQSTLAGQQDTFFAKFSADGQTVLYSTYLGGTGDERGEDYTADAAGNAYIVGYTTSTDFPMMNAIQPSNSGNIDGFVVKLNAAGNALVYSTYLGGTGEDQATGIAVDLAGDAYIVGYTTSSDFPIANPIQGTNHGGRDAFVTKLSANGQQFLYSTYLGGSLDENNWRDTNVAVDSTGNAYVAGLTWSSDFPVTSGAFQPLLKGAPDAFVVKIASLPPDTTPPAITVAVAPRVLWPPNGKIVPVRISGTITDSGSGVKPGSARYAVHDEYQLINSHGPITLDSDGNYSFTTMLRASRKGSDLNGRVYTVRINAKDNAGNRGAKATKVVVPHEH